MKEYVLDANAVIAFLNGDERENAPENAARVRRLIESARDGQAELFLSAINLGEVFYTLRKTNSEAAVLHMVSALRDVATVVAVTTETAIRAAELKYRHKLGYGDSFAALLAIERKATLVTADPEFDKLGKSLKLLRLQRFRGAE